MAAILGNKLGYHVLTHPSWTSCKSLVQLYNPSAAGQLQYDLIIPNTNFFTSQDGRNYIQALALADLSGLKHWIDFLGVCKANNFPILYISSLDELYALIRKHVGNVNPSTWLIPYFEMREGYNRGPTFIFKMISYQEYMSCEGMEFFYEFILHVVVIALLGFYPTAESCTVLGIANIEDYMRSRLIFGALDTSVQALKKMSISSMLPKEFMEGQEEINQSFVDLYSSMNDERDFYQRLDKVHQMSMNKYGFVGSNTEMYQALLDNQLIQTPHAEYKSYLSNYFHEKKQEKSQTTLAQLRRTINID
jgi:hypothetical protein